MRRAALKTTYQALVKADGGTKNVALWTQDANAVAAGLTMRQYDAIGFRALGPARRRNMRRQPARPSQRPVGNVGEAWP
jgi:hypothetical protein